MKCQKEQRIKSDMERIKNLSEEEIQRAALSDPDAQPTDDDFWLNAPRVNFPGCTGPEEFHRQAELLAADPHEKLILAELAALADTEGWTGERRQSALLDLVFKHKGYLGSIEYDDRDKVLHGRVLVISDVISYEGESVAELEQGFRDALEGYFLGCKEVGKESEIPGEDMEDGYLAEAILHRIRTGQEVIIPGDVVNRIILEKKSRIRAWREQLGLPQEDVARRMGVTPRAFAQLEGKGANVRPVTLKKIAKALGVELEQFMD